MGYFIDRLVLGKEAANTIWSIRFAFGLIGLTISLGVGLIFICHWTYQEVALELSYRQKYGAGWVAEFEQYHGSVSSAHVKIAIVVLSLFAIAVVLFWFFGQTFPKTKRRKERLHRSRSNPKTFAPL